MKKTLLFTFSLFVLTSVSISCSRDEEKGNPQALIGTWEFVSINNMILPIDTEIIETITFNADGTVILSTGDSATYTTRGWSIAFTYIDEDSNKIVIAEGATIMQEIELGMIALQVNSLTYSVSGENLTITMVAEASTMGMTLATTTISALFKKIN